MGRRVVAREARQRVLQLVKLRARLGDVGLEVAGGRQQAPGGAGSWIGGSAGAGATASTASTGSGSGGGSGSDAA